MARTTVLAAGRSGFGRHLGPVLLRMAPVAAQTVTGNLPKRGLKDWPSRTSSPGATGAAPLLFIFELRRNLYTLGQNGDSAFVIAFDAGTGKRLWQTSNGQSYFNSYGDGQRSTPTIDGDRLYALGAAGDLACLDAASGRVIWHKDLPLEFRSAVPQWGYSESPLVADDRLIVHVGGPGASIVAFNKLTGDVLWRSGSDGAAYSSGVITGRRRQ